MCFQAHLRRFQNLLLAGEAPPNFRYECILGQQLFNIKIQFQCLVAKEIVIKNVAQPFRADL
jgi:hypothetical protein